MRVSTTVAFGAIWFGLGLELWGCTPARPTTVDVMSAPATGEVADVVRVEARRAARIGRRLLVYVGAPWCEPCRRFHDAVKSGQLDGSFPGLRLLEFDHDRDEARLAAAGYTSRLIPLLALPAKDGRASGKQMEGSIKGDGAVGQMAPRLKELLGD
jgi:hypothetical protein